VAGLPAEHFLAKTGETWEGRWNSPSRMQYVRRVLQDNTTANGMFGTVVMWSYFDRMLQMLRDIPKYNALDGANLLASVLRQPKYVWLRRRNRVEQAVSWAIACQTGLWAQKAGEKPRPRAALPKFDFKVVDEWCNRIAEHNAAWANYFRENRIEPLTLFYEDVAANNRTAVERVLEFLNVPPARIEIAPHGLEKQADEISAQWIAAYLKQKNDSASKRDPIIRRLKQSLKRKKGPELP
jgi:LPS sulfotransferase NodH